MEVERRGGRRVERVEERGEALKERILADGKTDLCR
jgi:hypothetical protein